MALREQLADEINGNNAYIDKIINWLKSSETKEREWHTNLFDLEICGGNIYIYSCLNSNLQPDILTLDAFYHFLANCRAT